MSDFETFSCRCYANFVTNLNVLTHYTGARTILGTRETGFESGQFCFPVGRGYLIIWEVGFQDLSAMQWVSVRSPSACPSVHLSSVHLSLKSDFSETIQRINAKVCAKVPIHHICSRHLFAFFITFLFLVVNLGHMEKTFSFSSPLKVYNRLIPKSPYIPLGGGGGGL